LVDLVTIEKLDEPPKPLPIVKSKQRRTSKKEIQLPAEKPKTYRIIHLKSSGEINYVGPKLYNILEQVIIKEEKTKVKGDGGLFFEIQDWEKEE